jgi:hypothetical protein
VLLVWPAVGIGSVPSRNLKLVGCVACGCVRMVQEFRLHHVLITQPDRSVAQGWALCCLGMGCTASYPKDTWSSAAERQHASATDRSKEVATPASECCSESVVTVDVLW